MAYHLLSALDQTKRELRRVSIGATVVLWVALSAALLLAFVVADHYVPGGVPGLAGTGVRVLFVLGTAAAIVWAVVLPLIRRISDLYAARLIEKNHPEFNNTIVGALQLAGREELAGSIRVALAKQASRQISGIDVRGSVSNRPLRMVTRVALAIGLCFAAYVLIAPKSVMVSVRRALGAPIPPPTRTVIAGIEPANGIRVLAGQQIPFRVSLKGEAPSAARIRFSIDNGATWPTALELPLVFGGGGAWWGTRAGADVQRSMKWQLVAGDAKSEPRSVVVLPEPAVVDMQVELAYPRYTKLIPTTQPGGDIEAIAGTRATLRARTNVPVRQPVLEIGQGVDIQRRILSEPSADTPNVLLGTLVVTRDEQYTLRFQDLDGHANRALPHSIHVLLDGAPAIEWIDTGLLEATARRPIRLRARASDDFGLTRAALHWRRRGQAVAQRPVALKPSAGREWTIDDFVRADELGLKAGESADLWLSVWDNRENAEGAADYQRTDSTIRRVTVRADPTSAPSMAQRPESQPSDDEQSAVASAPEEEPGRTTRNESPPRRTLEEFTSEHEKELALLEAKLAKEMENEGGGRERRQIAELTPDRKQEPSPPSEPQEGSRDPQQGSNDESNSDPTSQPAPSGENPSKDGSPAPGQADSNPPEQAEASPSKPERTPGDPQQLKSQEESETSRSRPDGARQADNPAEAKSGQESERSDPHSQAPQARNAENPSGDGGERRKDEDLSSAEKPGSQRPEDASTSEASEQTKSESDDKQAKSNPAQAPSSETPPSPEQPPTSANESSRQSPPTPAAQQPATEDSPSSQPESEQGPRQAQPSPAQAPESQPSALALTSRPQDSQQPPPADQPPGIPTTPQPGTPQSPRAPTPQTPRNRSDEPDNTPPSTSEDQQSESPDRPPAPRPPIPQQQQEASESQVTPTDQAGRPTDKLGPGNTPGTSNSPGGDPPPGGAGDGDQPTKGDGAGKGGDGEGGNQPGQGKGEGPAQGGQGQGQNQSKEPVRGNQQSNDPGSSPDNQSEQGSPGGQVNPGNAKVGTGGREGGISTALPGTRPAQDEVKPLAGPERKESALTADGRRDRAVETLERQLRAGKVDPELLQQLGWNLTQAEQFIEAYHRAQEAGQRQVRETAMPTETKTTTQPAPRSTVLRGDARGGAARTFRTDTRPAADRVQGLSDPARQRVPAGYRPLLEAYYRSLASQPGP